MQLFVKIIITFQFVFLLVINLLAQNKIVPVASYSFNNKSVVDEMEYSELVL